MLKTTPHARLCHQRGVVQKVKGRNDVQLFRAAEPLGNVPAAERVAGNYKGNAFQVCRSERRLCRERVVAPHHDAPSVRYGQAEMFVFCEVCGIYHHAEVYQPLVQPFADVGNVTAEKVKAYVRVFVL